MRNQLPIIQNFFGRPVRFFRAEFWVELDHHHDSPGMRGHNDPPSGVPGKELNCHNGSPGQKLEDHDDPPGQGLHCHNDNTGLNKILIKTWAIPLPDYANAVGYEETLIRRIIRLNPDSFRDFYRTEFIPDRVTGQRRKTILMAIEMCDALTMRLQASRIKDPETRQRVINFQRWIIIAFHLLRTGRVRPVRWCLDREIPPEYIEALGMPSGRERRKLIQEIAKREGKSEQQIYRRLQNLSGSNTITRSGKPKRSPSHKGAYMNTDDYRSVVFVYTQWPEMKKKEIARVTGVSYGRVLRWLRAA